MGTCECLVNRRCRVAGATTAGLRRRSCACAFVHRKSRNFAGGRTLANKSGGRKPPVVAATAPAMDIPHTFAHDHRTRGTKSGGRESPVVPRTRLQRRQQTHRSAVCRTIAVAPLQVRQRDTRRADTRRSWRCAGRACPNMHVIAPATRLPVTRRAHVRRSCVWRSFAGEKATFALHKRIFAGTRAGGVSPPWFVNRRFGRRFDSRSTPAVTTVVTLPRLQRRAPTHRRQSAEQLRKRLSECVSRSHGGLTPAAPRACAFVHRKSRNSVGWRTSREQEWGRKPPVLHGNALARVFASMSERLPTVRQRIPLQSRYYTHGGLTPAALGACAFVHRKSRNSAGGQPRAKQERLA